MLTHLQMMEKRHKISFNVGTRTHLISFFFFFWKPMLAEMGPPPLQCLRTTLHSSIALERERLADTGLIFSVYLEIICGICFIETHFLCDVFQFLVAAMLCSLSVVLGFQCLFPLSFVFNFQFNFFYLYWMLLPHNLDCMTNWNN